MATRGGNLKATSINGVKIYSVTGQGRFLPTWASEKKRRALRKDTDYTQRVELVQDLRFETATTRIKATPDGEYLIASGIYPPQVKVYELRELALKFERHLISEIINFEVLGDDYSKIAFLCADRSVCLHAKYGSHYSLRIPRMGRDIAYDSWTCDLLCAASSSDLYRINLEQGRFLSSLVTKSPGLNVVTRSKIHGLVACGGDDGAVECFDMRARSSVGRLDVAAHAGDRDPEVTAVEFDGEGGYCMAVGCSSGKVLIYDMRSSYPMRVKDHMYGSPILNIKWQQTLNSEKPKLITTDSKIVRIWDPETGEGMTSIEPKDGGINDICVFNESGLMLLALNSSEIPSYFIPALGPAPKWCSYLENLTEEMEEGAQTTIYDDFKFLTKEELERLGLTNLIGTNFLRAYMHGFFVHYGLYKKAQALANPFAYDAYLEKRKQDKLEAQRKTRITMTRKLPKINRELAARLLEAEEEENEKGEEGVEVKKKSKKKKGQATELLKDERFAKIFENKEFEVDEFSQEYLALHPLGPPAKQPSLVEEHFDPVTRDGNEDLSDSDVSDDDNDHKNRKKLRAPRLYEVKDGMHEDAFFNRVSLAKEHSLSLGERAATMTDRGRGSGYSNDVKVGPGGSREISFVSRSKSRYKEDDFDDDQRGKKRGVQSLGLKPDRSSGFGGRGRGRGRGGRGGSRGGRGRERGRGRGGW